MPPIQWEKLRQIKVALDRSSTFGTTLEPVVVKPDTISNSASIKRGISPLSQNGIHPKRLSTIQPIDTSTNPSFAKNIFTSGFFLVHRKPRSPQTQATAI